MGYLPIVAYVVGYNVAAYRRGRSPLSAVARAHPRTTAVAMLGLAAHFARPARWARYDPLSRMLEGCRD